jgi:hypothetical protein
MGFHSTTPTPEIKEPIKKHIYLGWARVISNILLSILLIVALYTIINYKLEVSEALGYSEPNRLMQIYEERTDTTCRCYSNLLKDDYIFPDPIKVMPK